MNKVAKIVPKRRNVFRFKTPEVKPVTVPATDKPVFPWWQRTHWDTVWARVTAIVALVLKLFPKTAIIGELLGKITTKTKSWADIIIEFIQAVIIKLKSMRRK